MWFQRKDKGILTPTVQKKDTKDGLWCKTSSGKMVHRQVLRDNAYVSPEDGSHVSIGSSEYFELLFDQNRFVEIAAQMTSIDPLQFVDTKSYARRLKEAQVRTGLRDAIRVAEGQVGGRDAVIACMDFAFIGGSMGSVVGEKIAKAVDRALARKTPLLIISKSGGARMMEGALSLMQMAKVCAKLRLLSEAKLPYVSLMTHPTTGGVSASFAMLGDFNFAEPGALIGFAGPRVVREAVGKELPAGFQSAESVYAHGFVDGVVDRRLLKATLTRVFNLIC